MLQSSPMRGESEMLDHHDDEAEHDEDLPPHSPLLGSPLLINDTPTRPSPVRTRRGRGQRGGWVLAPLGVLVAVGAVAGAGTLAWWKLERAETG
jgi:hypothetical protein